MKLKWKVQYVKIINILYDNKRTPRLVANCILLSTGQGILNVKVKNRLTFNTLMLEFYDTRKADNIVELFYLNCLER